MKCLKRRKFQSGAFRKYRELESTKDKKYMK